MDSGRGDRTSRPDGSDARVSFSNPQVNLYTADIEASVRFYRDVLGFTESFRTPKEAVPSHVEFRLGSFTLGVATFEALERDHGIATGRGPPRVELALFTDDVDGAYGWAVSKGAASISPPHDFGGYIHSAGVTDPDGNPVILTTQLPLKGSANPTAAPSFKNHLFNVYTKDIEGSLGFYRDLVGFTETFRAPKQGPADHVEMELGTLNLSVSTIEALQRDHGFSGGGGPPRAEVVLWVPDVDLADGWLAARGVPSLSRPHDFAGVLRGAWVSDPDGNPVQLVSRPGLRQPGGGLTGSARFPS
jgi:catechol 2,3-dioxygenase-like lactoylglutathione lyase family enzyme